MEIGALTGYLDVAQVVLYVFFAFFFGLIVYLHRENKREGYPMIVEKMGKNRVGTNEGYFMPGTKTFEIQDGSTVTVSDGKSDDRPIKGKGVEVNIGSALIPDGDPMLSETGPGSYAERMDVPDMTFYNEPKLAPIRLATDFHVDENDPDPRGMDVVGFDGEVGAKVTDIWIDRGEHIIRYLEIEKSAGGKTLIPMTMVRIGDTVQVASIMGSQFKDVPGLANPDQVTRLEEDKISAYYGGGHLFATPGRSEPLI